MQYRSTWGSRPIVWSFPRILGVYVDRFRLEHFRLELKLPPIMTRSFCLCSLLFYRCFLIQVRARLVLWDAYKRQVDLVHRNKNMSLPSTSYLMFLECFDYFPYSPSVFLPTGTMNPSIRHIHPNLVCVCCTAVSLAIASLFLVNQMSLIINLNIPWVALRC